MHVSANMTTCFPRFAENIYLQELASQEVTVKTSALSDARKDAITSGHTLGWLCAFRRRAVVTTSSLERRKLFCWCLSKCAPWRAASELEATPNSITHYTWKKSWVKRTCKPAERRNDFSIQVFCMMFELLNSAYKINWKLRTEKWLLTQFAYGIRPPTQLCLRDAHLLTWSWKRELVTYKNILVLLECADRKFQFWVEWYVSDYMMKYCGHLFPLVTIITSSFKGYFILLLHIGVGYVASPIVQGYAETKSLHLAHCQEVRCLIIREDLDNTSGLIEVWHSLNAMTGFTVKKPEVGPHTFCTGRYNLLSRIGLRTSRRAMFYSR